MERLRKKSAKAEKEAWIVRAKFLFKLAGTTNPIHLLKLRNLDKKEEKIEEHILFIYTKTREKKNY